VPAKKAIDLTTRHTTRHRGILYRNRAGGLRTYSVYDRGKYVTVEGGEQEAIALQADLRAKKARGEQVVRPSKLTFAEAADEWFLSKRHLRAWTRKSYRDSLDRVLIPRFGSYKVAAITVEDVAGLIRDLERQGLATSYIENHLKPLTGTLGFAVRRGMISVNPFTRLTPDDRPQRRERKQDHIWSDEEIEALIEAAERIAKQPTSRYNYGPLLRMACFTGLRLGELLGLRWENVDLQEGVLHVQQQYTRLGEYGPPKTKAALRRLPLSDEMKSYLAALKLRSLHSKDADPVFACRTGGPLGHRNVTRRGFEAAAKRAGIEGVTFHSMRHAFASRMIHRGISSVVLAALMGHESSAITERRYIHLFDALRTDDAVRQAMAAGTAV
jgi:integrase